MADVAPREVAAAVALAPFLDGPLVERPLRRLDRDVAVARDRRAVAGDARRNHAVEHVDAARDALGHLVHYAEPHHVARLVLGEIWDRSVDRLVHELLGLAHRDAAYRVAVEADLDELLGAVAADVVVDSALNDAEDHLAVGVRRVLRGLRPAQGLLDRLLGPLALAGVGQAFVEDHRDVRADDALHLHRLLRPEEELVAVDMGVEAAPFLGDFAHPGERKDLEAARIGEDRPVPAHEAVKPAGGREDLRAGAQHEVVGVAQDDLRPQLLEVARLQRLDRPKRANIHKNGGFDGAVGGKKPPQPRPRTRIRL